ncbi:MAG: hypothetical protein ACYTBV_20990 [Planctomycetota bacterium]|jgi:hypothetical protein
MRDAESLRPDIFGDKEIANKVKQSVTQLVSSGNAPPEIQSDTDSLVAMGVYFKDQRDAANPPKTPVTPVATESPAQVKTTEPAKRPVDFDRDEEDFIKYFQERVAGFEDFSKEDAAELVREADKEKRGK